MALAPIDQLIEVKPRPQTTLQLLAAIEDPIGTVADYVFTPSIKEHYNLLLQNLRSGHGGGYWVLSEYGGGKTHFLATLLSLLSATDLAADHVTDEDMKRNVQNVKDQRLFPVAFSLIGRGDMLDRRNALFRILEEEIQGASHRLLDVGIPLTLTDEVKEWWDALGEGTRSDIAKNFQSLFHFSPDVGYSDSQERWTEQITAAAASLGIRMEVSATPVDRFTAMYRQIVNERTGYTGMLVVMDEFASWQDQRPESRVAYTEDENLLQTLAETLPKDHGLNVFTVVASQKPMPRKFEGGRFRQFDLLRPSEQSISPSFEYAMVVASRVRAITKYREPEIEEYHEHYSTRFDFARDLSLDNFESIFPMQPLSFDILRRITSNLTSARTGINVLWDVLGEGDPDQPELRSGLTDTTRLITASDLLESDTLVQDLRQSVRYGSAYLAYQQAIEQVERLAARNRIFEEDVPVAKVVVRTLFLWHCSRDGQMNISLDEMTEAVIPDEGFLDSPQDSLLSVLGSMDDVSQVDFDPDKGELSFRADIVAGRSGTDVFDEYRARFSDPGTVQTSWQENLTNPNLVVGTFSAVLGGLETEIRVARTTTYRGINYGGELVATADWQDELAGQLPFDTHFRLVFILRDDMAVAPELLEDDRILVCVPDSLSAEHRNAMTDMMALNAIQEDYKSRQDDEALRVSQFVNSRRAEITNALLVAQRDFYKRGRIISRQNLVVDTDDVFGSGGDLLARIITQLFDHLFVDRPIGSFRRNRSMNLNTETSRVFTGLWERESDRSTRNALENFAVGLGLSQPDNPLRYDPRNCGAFDIIRSMYMAAKTKGENCQVDQIYEKLSSVGVPARLATLYLLCYVRSNTEVELLLKGGHRIRLTDGGELQGNTIHSNIVPKIEWHNRAFATASYFDILMERTGPVWNHCLGWTRNFDPDLEDAADPELIQQETGQLLNSLRIQQERLQSASEQLRTLELQLNDNIPFGFSQSASLVLRLTKSDSLEEFMMIIESSNLIAPDELARAVTDTHNLNLVGQIAIEVASVHTYLNSVPASRLNSEFPRLGEDRTALARDINLNNLVGRPSEWSRIKERFETWKRVYIREYRKIHRDFHLEVSEMSRKLSGMHEQLLALENIERLDQIAQTKHSRRLREQIEAIEYGIMRCDPNIEVSAVEAMPYCTQCGVRVGDLPTLDLASIESQITHVLGELIATLSSDSIDEVLANSESPVLVNLRESIRKEDTMTVINVLKDKGHADLLAGILKGDDSIPLIVRDVSIVSELSREFPTVSQEAIPDVVNRFRELVEDALRTQQGRVGMNVKVEMRLH